MKIFLLNILSSPHVTIYLFYEFHQKYFHFFCEFLIEDLLIAWFLKFSAIKAVEVGVAGIIVSNHGARQLDYSPATISALEEVTINFTPLLAF